MHGKIKKNMGFSLIPFAFIFLFEPNYGLYDIFPDLIGYSVLCAALYNLADINDRIHTAVKGFRKGIVLSIFRIISIIVLDRLFDSSERTVGQLVFIFIPSILELFFMIPAYTALFNGMLHLGIFESGNAVYYKKSERGKNASEKLYILTLVFLILKNALCVLPELTSLQTNTSYEFVGIMRTLAILLMMPVSVIWLIKSIVYFLRVSKDTDFIDALTLKYRERADAAPEVFTYRIFTVGLWALLLGFVFTVDIYVPHVNILPDIFAYSFIIFAALFLKKYSSRWSLAVILSSVGFFLSLSIYFLEDKFFSRFDISAVIKDLDAYNQYNLLVCLYALKAGLFLFALFFVLRFIYDIFTEAIAKKEGIREGYIEEHDKRIRSKLKICFLLGALSAIATVYRVFSLPRFDVSFIFNYSVLITLAIQIAFVSYACTFFSYLLSEIKYNYQSYL